MTSLQGYVVATYNELVAVLGQPTDEYPSADGKVDTEWELTDNEGCPVTLYDWKCYGQVARGDDMYRWHVGGTNRWAVEFFSNLGLDARYARS